MNVLGYSGIYPPIWGSFGFSRTRIGHKRGILLSIFAQKEQTGKCDKTSNGGQLGWCRGSESNRHELHSSLNFESIFLVFEIV